MSSAFSALGRLRPRRLGRRFALVHPPPSCTTSSSAFFSGTRFRRPLATVTNKHSNLPSPPTQRRTATRPSSSPEGAHPLLLIPIMALGGLGAILLSGHPSLSLRHVISQVDLRSVFFAVVFVIIVLVLGTCSSCLLSRAPFLSCKRNPHTPSPPHY